jgi:hypothetical protein
MATRTLTSLHYSSPASPACIAKTDQVLGLTTVHPAGQYGYHDFRGPDASGARSGVRSPSGRAVFAAFGAIFTCLVFVPQPF